MTENPYIQPARITAALRDLGLRPTRGMGQNFLIDGAALGRIVAAAELTPADTVLEVGPGLGVLTWELLQRARRVVTVELDRRLAARLAEELGANQKLAIVQSDILRITPSEALGPHSALSPQPFSYKLVANLPYAITSAVLRHFLEAEAQPELVVVLVQWEVAQRIVAAPGDLSVLAHSIQIYAEPEIIARVPGSSFLPAPAVDSAILRLRVRPQPLVARTQIDQHMRLIKAGFLLARKMLSNSLPSGLASQGLKIDKQQVLAALEVAGVSPDRRAETVTLDEWQALYATLQPNL
ncbi:MAG: 16S rRNA (adenine(1518)-N(6)/adenine(1519)-N(6))-dimethyltransferase RsmA [Roseiflexaceae bacterium]|nr:16S rRNA (adenine(1518)-N(6)/adenine(1519)-N(6))-dimethyltransferase RsmA [Roseiflexaceae bacterium]